MTELTTNAPLHPIGVASRCWVPHYMPGVTADQKSWLKFTDIGMEHKWANSRIPISALAEAYGEGTISINGDVLEAMKSRHLHVSYKLTLTDLWQIFVTWTKNRVPWIPVTHRTSPADVERAARPRNTDFFKFFLGPGLTFSSGCWTRETTTLDVATKNAFNDQLTAMDARSGMKLLDMSSDWGSFAMHAASQFKMKVTGLSPSKTQTTHATEAAAKAKVGGENLVFKQAVRPKEGQKFDRIALIDHPELASPKDIQRLLSDTVDALDDDGRVLLQVSGVRMRPYSLQDIAYSLFISRYIFPDSEPSDLGTIISAATAAGLEVVTAKNISLHAAATATQWYKNWMKNQEAITASYGAVWFRVWAFFLAWTSIAPRIGITGQYQIVLTKALGKSNRVWQLPIQPAPSTPPTAPWFYAPTPEEHARNGTPIPGSWDP